MEGRIPVGFMIKRKPKPGVEYDILGLGFVEEWADGYFTIEGISHDGETHVEPDASRARASQSVLSVTDSDFDAENEVDLRQRQIVTVAVRKGQPRFRASLLAADASLIEADANKQNSTPKEDWDRNAINPDDAPRAVKEYLDVLDDAAFGAATTVEPIPFARQIIAQQ